MRSLVIRCKFLLPIHDLVCCGILYNLSRSIEEIRGLVKAILSSQMQRVLLQQLDAVLKKPKREQVKQACHNCRRRKTKVRPN